jgi:pilus assembly protein Flp/PilA
MRSPDKALAGIENLAGAAKRPTLSGKEENMFSKINEALVAFVSRFEREDGQALAEYGLLLALIAVACLAALTALGLAIAGTLGSITGSL